MNFVLRGWRRIGALIAAAAALAAAGPAEAERRVALVIGNSAYKEAPLNNPRNDATDMAQVLTEAGFRVILRRDVDARAMRQAVRDFGNELRRADVGLFYYAGHGMQIGGNNYLVPIGADIRNEADAEDLSLDVNYVLRTMEDSRVDVRLMILDACRNNPYQRGFRSTPRGLASMTATTGSLIAFATAPGSVAADGEGRNGVYTKYLLESLRQSDTDILKVFQRTRAGVVRETGGRQTPWESTSLLGDFHFKPRAIAAATTTPAVAAAAAAAVVKPAPAPVPAQAQAQPQPQPTPAAAALAPTPAPTRPATPPPAAVPTPAATPKPVPAAPAPHPAPATTAPARPAPSPAPATAAARPAPNPAPATAPATAPVRPAPNATVATRPAEATPRPVATPSTGAAPAAAAAATATTAAAASVPKPPGKPSRCAELLNKGQQQPLTLEEATFLRSKECRS